MKRRTLLAAGFGSAFAACTGTLGVLKLGEIFRSKDVSASGNLYSGAALAFGTTLSIQVIHPNQAEAERAIADAFDEAKNIDRLMSIYADSSQVFRLNRDGYLAQPDAHILQVLQTCRDLYALSEGAFDITVQPAWKLFSEYALQQHLPPETSRLAAAALINFKDLRYDSNTVQFSKPGMSITLNGIAQGYAVDLALSKIKQYGIQDALLDTGEFISLGQASAGRKWTLGIQDPRQMQNFAAQVAMDGRSVATSGDYETTFTPDFVHNHIFDPATGDSPTELASVTVLAPTGLLADGLSTAMFVMGTRRSLELAKRLENVDVLMIDKAGRMFRTAYFS